jgi:hypothetical protein
MRPRRVAVPQRRPLDAYPVRIYTGQVIAWDEAKRRGVVVSIVHTEVDYDIHVISMRKATKREEQIYFKSIAH